MKHIHMAAMAVIPALFLGACSVVDGLERELKNRIEKRNRGKGEGISSKPGEGVTT